MEVFCGYGELYWFHRLCVELTCECSVCIVTQLLLYLCIHISVESSMGYAVLVQPSVLLSQVNIFVYPSDVRMHVRERKEK